METAKTIFALIGVLSTIFIVFIFIVMITLDKRKHGQSMKVKGLK